MQLDKERTATSAPENQTGVLVVHKHHLLVRLSHWLNVPILLGLILSGVSTTARHPQTLLATHLNGKPLTVEHPLRLLVPVKLSLKNIKAITRITYTKDEPADYWAKRGYSRYDGI